MKIDIDLRIHYWPATPHLREVKLYLEGELMRSTFISVVEMENLQHQFKKWIMNLEGAIQDIQT